MKFKWVENQLFLAIVFLPPALLGFWIGKQSCGNSPLWPNAAAVDIVKVEDKISVLHHRSGAFLRAYTLNEDKIIYQEFEKILEWAGGSSSRVDHQTKNNLSQRL